MTHPAWHHHHPVQIDCGWGQRRVLCQRLAGQRLLIVTTRRGRKQFETDPILSSLLQPTTPLWLDTVNTNPGLTELQQHIDTWRSVSCDAIIALGGGSVMDTAKVLAVALSADLSHPELATLLQHSPLTGVRPKPLYAVPTTAGTGSEVTPFATVWDHTTRQKYSLAGSALYPQNAVVDAELSIGLPYAVTLASGLDAINQAAESIWNRRMTPISAAFATRALQLGFMALPQLAQALDHHHAREAMAESSLLAGLAISQTRTALCHSISYPLTAHFGISHGLACAFTMPAVLKHNLSADDGRLARLAVQLLGQGHDGHSLLAPFQALHEQLQVQAQVKARIPDRAALLALSPKMLTPGRADNNLAAVDEGMVRKILIEAWG